MIVYLSLFNFSTKLGIILSNSQIMVSSFVRLFTGIGKPSPARAPYGTPFHFNIMSLMIPMTTVGASVATVVNKVIPDLYLTVLFLLILSCVQAYNIWRLVNIIKRENGLESRAKDTAKKAEENTAAVKNAAEKKDEETNANLAINSEAPAQHREGDADVAKPDQADAKIVEANNDKPDVEEERTQIKTRRLSASIGTSLKFVVPPGGEGFAKSLAPGTIDTEKVKFRYFIRERELTRKEIRAFIRTRESTFLQWKYLIQVLTLIVGFMIIMWFKGSGKDESIVGVEKCDAGYWGLFSSLVVFGFMLSSLAILIQKQEYELK